MKKKCSSCNVEKDINDFHKRTENGINGRKSSCKTCRNAKRRQYAAANRDKETQRMAKWRRENPKKKLAADREWRAKNPDKVKLSDKKWKAKNRDKLSAQKSKRRALRIGLNEKFDALDRIEVFRRFDNKCFYCCTTDDLTIDHHIPLSCGKILSHSNAVVLCRSCNSSKGTRIPGEFYSIDQIIKLNNILGHTIEE